MNNIPYTKFIQKRVFSVNMPSTVCPRTEKNSAAEKCKESTSHSKQKKGLKEIRDS